MCLLRSDSSALYLSPLSAQNHPLFLSSLSFTPFYFFLSRCCRARASFVSLFKFQSPFTILRWFFVFSRSKFFPVIFAILTTKTITSSTSAPFGALAQNLWYLGRRLQFSQCITRCFARGFCVDFGLICSPLSYHHCDWLGAITVIEPNRYLLLFSPPDLWRNIFFTWGTHSALFVSVTFAVSLAEFILFSLRFYHRSA